MAAIAISELTALTAPATADALIVVDDSASDNKALTLAYMTRASDGNGPDVTGGGKIALGGYTLTVPVTGTAALLNDEQTFTGLKTFSSGLIINGGTYAAGKLYKTATDGLLLAGVTGGANDFVVINGSGGTIFEVPTGTTNLRTYGKISINTATSDGQLVVDQSSATGAIPVLYLDQGDVDQPLIQFETTIGTGNAVEAVGAKTLTTTHFLMVELPGGLTRYIPCGTIA